MLDFGVAIETLCEMKIIDASFVNSDKFVKYE